MFLALVVVLLTISLGRAAYLQQRYDSATATLKSDSSKVPQYFQTSPELFAGELPCSLTSVGIGIAMQS